VHGKFSNVGITNNQEQITQKPVAAESQLKI
jgi:hypothetical protein